MMKKNNNKKRRTIFQNSVERGGLPSVWVVVVGGAV